MTNCHELDHGHWEVKTKSGSTSAGDVSEAEGSFNITIVKPPGNIILEPENINVKSFVNPKSKSKSPVPSNYKPNPKKRDLYRGKLHNKFTHHHISSCTKSSVNNISNCKSTIPKTEFCY